MGLHLWVYVCMVVGWYVCMVVGVCMYGYMYVWWYVCMVVCMYGGRGMYGGMYL